MYILGCDFLIFSTTCIPKAKFWLQKFLWTHSILIICEYKWFIHRCKVIHCIDRGESFKWSFQKRKRDLIKMNVSYIIVYWNQSAKIRYAPVKHTYVKQLHVYGICKLWTILLVFLSLNDFRSMAQIIYFKK